jgi:hypothetical protein
VDRQITKYIVNQRQCENLLLIRTPVDVKAFIRDRCPQPGLGQAEVPARLMEEAIVLAWGRGMGRVHGNSHGKPRLLYDCGWQKKDDVYPIFQRFQWRSIKYR